MANPYFKFKQFTVFHDKCAMKVGTDGVLLGAWVRTNEARRVLDIGTGTGLIALMIAQRCQAPVDAIDIDAHASEQATENVSASPFNRQITVRHTSLASYAAISPHRYDLIVSNPPYFNQSLKCPDNQRSKARHNDTLPLDTLIRESNKLLSPAGRIALILPVEQEELLIHLLKENGLYRIRQTNVIPVVGGSVKRILTEASPTPPVSGLVVENMAIEIQRHLYTPEYAALTRDYYLNI